MTHLAHKGRDHTVEAAALEVQRLASLANALLACILDTVREFRLVLKHRLR